MYTLPQRGKACRTSQLSTGAEGAADCWRVEGKKGSLGGVRAQHSLEKPAVALKLREHQIQRVGGLG